jgi:hypothetical protein
MNSARRFSLLAVSLASCCAAMSAQGAAGDWQQTVIIYGMGAAIDGDATIGDLTVPVDVSMSEVFDALEMGAMGAYRADNGTWSFMVDATFMGLGGTAESQRDIVKGDMDLDQMTLMGTVGRRFTPTLEGLFSLTWFDLSTDLKLTTRNPIGGAETTRTTSVDANWIDPMLGLQYNVPFADDWRFNLRGDIGGFGIGADLSYQLLANVRYQATDKIGVAFGYRVIGYDYEDGDKGDRDYQHFDLVEQGPLVGLTISF